MATDPDFERTASTGAGRIEPEPWPTSSDATLPSRRPRTLTVVKFLGLVGALSVISRLTYSAAHAASDSEEMEAKFTASIITLVVMWACFTILASRVGYAWPTAVVAFWIPFYSFVLTIRVVWRIASLPQDPYWRRSYSRQGSHHRTN